MGRGHSLIFILFLDPTLLLSYHFFALQDYKSCFLFCYGHQAAQSWVYGTSHLLGPYSLHACVLPLARHHLIVPWLRVSHPLVFILLGLCMFL